MRHAVAILALALSAMTASGQPSSERLVSFTVAEANSILDSLRSRGDWQRMFALQTARLNNRNSAITQYQWMDSLSKVQLAMCDSVRRKNNAERLRLEGENAKLNRRSSKRGTAVPIALMLGVIIGLILN